MNKIFRNCLVVCALSMGLLIELSHASPLPNSPFSAETPFEQQPPFQQPFGEEEKNEEVTTAEEISFSSSMDASFRNLDDTSDQGALPPFPAGFENFTLGSEGNWTEFDMEGRSLGKIKDAGQRLWVFMGFEKVLNWLTGKKDARPIYFPHGQHTAYPSHHSSGVFNAFFKPLKTETKPVVAVHTQSTDYRPSYY